MCDIPYRRASTDRRCRCLCGIHRQAPLSFCQLYSFIERNYNKNITIKTISDKFGVSKDYINKLTKKYYGLSFSDTLKSIRMNNSVFMMKMTSSGLKSISYLCGYRYYSNFYKCFTEFFGETPSEKYKRINHVSVDEP